MAMTEQAQELMADLVAQDSEMEFKIKNNTELHRKGFGKFVLTDSSGEEIKKAKITLKQTGHEFHFGCNAFLVDQFPEKEQNEQYEKTFANLFNLAVVPLYWSDLEPEEGNPRFAKDSAPVYRRPPVDRMIEFCNEHGITPKGHPLCWHSFWPEWMPNNTEAVMDKLDERFRKIYERYGDKIRIWDCVNEAQTRNPLRRKKNAALPEDHVEKAFKLAERYFYNSTLIYNDDNQWWNYQGDYSPVYLLVQRLLEQGCKVGGLGLQYHMFESLLDQSDLRMNPRNLYTFLDLYAKLNIPVNFSEVSIISRRDLGEGDKFQEIVTEKLYRIWFSHPATNGIVWWNLVDGTAAYAPMGSEEGENSLRAGLVNYDFSPKPAYKVLERLIKEEWNTKAEVEYVAGADNRFHGFYGDYEATISTDKGEVKMPLSLSKNSNNKFELSL